MAAVQALLVFGGHEAGHEARPHGPRTHPESVMRPLVSGVRPGLTAASWPPCKPCQCLEAVEAETDLGPYNTTQRVGGLGLMDLITRSNSRTPSPEASKEEAAL